MSEPQLERSVLEAKEREELFAIADALGTKPTSRARKSDLVTLILRATGVEAGAEEPDKPRRGRPRKTAGDPQSGDAPTESQLPLDAPDPDEASEDASPITRVARPRPNGAAGGPGRRRPDG